MKKFLFLILILALSSSTTLYAQSFDQIVAKYEKMKGAEVMTVPGFMMKMVMAFADDESEGMSEEEKKFMKRISSMTILDMEECSQNDKLKFAADMRQISIDGFEAIDVEKMTTGRLFFHKGEKKNEMVIAIYDGETYSLMMMRGRFDEEAAEIFASSKQEESQANSK